MKLSDFNLIDDDKEKESLEALIQDFNRTTTDYPRNKTVHALFAEQVVKTPDAIAVISSDNSFTYQLEQRSNQLARFLIDNGLQSEALVGCAMLDRSIELVVYHIRHSKGRGCLSSYGWWASPTFAYQYMLQDTVAIF